MNWIHTRFIIAVCLAILPGIPSRASYFYAAASAGGGGFSWPAGLVAHWNMDEVGTPAGTRNDGVGTADLTDTNGIDGAAGLLSNAADLERTNSESFTTTDSGVMLTGSYTCCMWINAESYVGAYEGLFAIASAKSRWYIRDSTRVRCDHGGETDDFTYTRPATGGWNFYVFGKDTANNTVFFSLNGAAKTTAANTATVTAGSTFYLGYTDLAGGERWDGLMDEVALFNTVLSNTEISDLYNSGAGRAYP